MKNKVKILISKPGLDGHDKGSKIIAIALKNAGFKVFYSGLHQNINQIIQKTKTNSINAIGLSVMTGNNIEISKKCMQKLKKEKVENVKLIVRDIIPKKDINKLIDIGVDAVFPSGTKLAYIIKCIKNLF